MTVLEATPETSLQCVLWTIKLALCTQLDTLQSLTMKRQKQFTIKDSRKTMLTKKQFPQKNENKSPAFIVTFTVGKIILQVRTFLVHFLVCQIPDDLFETFTHKIYDFPPEIFSDDLFKV